MKLAKELSSEKLRGGFYTPSALVDLCLDRVLAHAGDQSDLTVLEPSAGNGAFLRGLAKHKLGNRLKRFVGIEILESEAQKSQEYGRSAPFDNLTRHANTLEWATETDEVFDAIIGNPPFVRYQFVPKPDLKVIEQLGERIGVPFRGVSNLWIPMLLGALSRLKHGGSMAMVVPAEIFTGLSAGDVRSWLLRNFDDLHIDSFPPGAFPDVLQEVIVLSGKRTEYEPQLNVWDKNVEFVEHGLHGNTRCWSHRLSHGTEGWTKFLLTPRQLETLYEVESLPIMQTFGNVAKLEVSIVTGANDYFSITTEDVEHFGLHEWSEPLLPRIRHARGLIYNEDDHMAVVANGAKAWLLNFSEHRPDPLKYRKPADYIKVGEARHLDKRYKTSIRAPWYRVPSVWAGKLLLSKRSHWFPQLVLNNANVLTTDTIYRGSILPLYAGRESDLVAAFHNSLTLLTAEIRGRSFGGGVLELVPSEIARLTVPFPISVSEKLSHLDEKARVSSERKGDRTDLIEATDNIVCKRVAGLTESLMDELREAREALATRRFKRNT